MFLLSPLHANIWKVSATDFLQRGPCI